MSRPTPSEFENYQQYLSAMVSFLKRTQSSFSYRAFARRAGFSSSGFLKHVIEGERRLSAASIPKVAKGLGLSEKESAQFESLVLLTLATTDEARNRLTRRLRSQSERRRLSNDEFELFSHPLAVTLRELITMAQSPSSTKSLAARLRPRARPADVRKALKLLKEMGLVEENEDGSLSAVRGTLETAPQVRSLAVRNFHRHALTRARDALEDLPPSERHVASLTVKLTPEKYELFTKKIDEFQDALLETLEDSDPGSDEAEVYTLALSLIPNTKKALS